MKMLQRNLTVLNENESEQIKYISKMYKDLKSNWDDYMENPVFHDFPPNKMAHDIFNHTKHIYQNVDFFIRALLESHLKLTDDSFLDFKGLYPEILSPLYRVTQK